MTFNTLKNYYFVLIKKSGFTLDSMKLKLISEIQIKDNIFFQVYFISQLH